MALLKKTSLTKNTLKVIAVIAMTIDHIGMILVPSSSVLSFAMRFVGRLTAPIMCMFLAEGYFYTSNKRKYGARLLVFAVLSQVPYALAHGNSLLKADFNMIFTLFFCFLILLANEKVDNAALRAVVICLLAAATCFSDWGVIAPLWVLSFYAFRENKKKLTVAYLLIFVPCMAMPAVFSASAGQSLFREAWQAGLLLFVPLIYLYRGEEGKKTTLSKWFFYVYYPLHLLLLVMVDKYIWLV